MGEQLSLKVLHANPLVEISTDGKQVWVEDKLVWEIES